jgi:hypothetical protein
MRMLMAIVEFVGDLQRVGEFLLGDLAVAVGVEFREQVVDAGRCAGRCSGRCGRNFVHRGLQIGLREIALSGRVEFREQVFGHLRRVGALHSAHALHRHRTVAADTADVAAHDVFLSW